MTCRIRAMTEEDTITHLSGNFYSVGGVSSPMRTACGDSTYKNFEGRQHHQVKPGCFIKGRGVHVTGRNVTAGGEGNIEKRPFPRAWIEFIGRGKAAATVLKLYSPVDLPSIEDKLDEEEQLVIHACCNRPLPDLPGSVILHPGLLRHPLGMEEDQGPH